MLKKYSAIAESSNKASSFPSSLQIVLIFINRVVFLDLLNLRFLHVDIRVLFAILPLERFLPPILA